MHSVRDSRPRNESSGAAGLRREAASARSIAAFTLIEVLVVVAIMALLMAFVVPKFQSVFMDMMCSSDLRSQWGCEICARSTR